MKSLFIVFLLTVGSMPVSSQRIWKLYKPVRSKLIGVPVNRYVTQTKELATTSSKEVFDIITFDGASRDFDEFKRKAALDIIGFVSNKMKVSTIDAAGKIYIDQVSSIEKSAQANFILGYAKTNEKIRILLDIRQLFNEI